MGTKLLTNKAPEKPSKPIRRMRMHWGEAKIQFCSLITPYGYELIREKATKLQISKSDLVEYLVRKLDEPDVEQDIARQVKP
ncbi:hypothetical protein PI95_030465 [Hassallia byssoidea VB512170]|uniref:Uncharacterized protein n=1 Tax=Hassallia byssoidea VB512170 TaxID=1304833 RepID=A0A846HGU7_9CYAN|nr:hypothetical protein [Hassalia byssoidea]NEU76717.1 hypothetical protein [Hassalia byssoidea VB512170]